MVIAKLDPKELPANLMTDDFTVEGIIIKELCFFSLEKMFHAAKWKF